MMQRCLLSLRKVRRRMDKMSKLVDIQLRDDLFLVSVRTDSERKTALDRIEDLMDAKAGTPAGEELSRLSDWVLEYDAQQERREEIDTLKREIADLRDSMSDILKIVNGVMDLAAKVGKAPTWER